MSEFKDYLGFLTAKASFTVSDGDVITITISADVTELWIDAATGNLTDFAKIDGSVTTSSQFRPFKFIPKDDPNAFHIAGYAYGLTLRDLFVGTPDYPAQIDFDFTPLILDGYSNIGVGATITFSNISGSYFGTDSNLTISGTETFLAVLREAAPEIVVTGSVTSGFITSTPDIVDGDTTPSITDGTDFGTVMAGSTPIVHTFWVKNTGNVPLTTSWLALPSGFTVVNPLSTSIAANGMDSFQIRFDTTTAGTKSGEIVFTSNDGNESPFNFTITGTVAALPRVEIEVSGNGGNNIADGTSSFFATPLNGTLFDNGTQGVPSKIQTFTVTNSGTVALTTSGLTIPSGFVLVEGLSSSIAPGSSDTFQVRLDTTNVGLKQGEVSFATNDTDENPFNFGIWGNVNPLLIPEVAVSTSIFNEIADGDTIPNTFDLTDFGEISQTEAAVVRTFTVSNKGSGPLTISGLTLPAGFSLVEGLSPEIAAHGSDTFQVRLDIATPGTKTGQISFTTNDSDENPFNFSITGTVYPTPVLSISAYSADKTEGNHGTKPFWFEVTRSEDTSIVSTVHWTLGLNGNPAASASDFSGATSGDLTFYMGYTSQVVTLNIVGDSKFESGGLPEHFTVTLSSPTGATLGTSTASGNIRNDDARPVTDFDGDGKSDFLWQQDNFQPAAWLMNGSTIASGGTINFVNQSPANPGPGWHIKGTGDFNSDGNADIIWQEDNGKPAIWLVNGFQLSSGGYIVYTDLTVTDPGTNWHIMGSGDFNSDGNADLLWQDDNGMPAIWLINGFQLSSGGYIVYTNLTPASPGPTWHIKGAADFNGDGNADVLWQDDLGNPAIWLVNGFVLSSGGYIVNPDLTPANLGGGWHIKGAGDFDGDGKSDVVWQHDDGRAAIWLIDGFALRSSTIMATNPGPNWNVTGAGDYDGDGKADIQWQNDDGRPMVWFMDGTTVLDTANVGGNPGTDWHLDWV